VKQSLPAIGFGLVVLGFASLSSAGELDRIIAQENQAADVKLAELPVVDDPTFLRRVYVDLIGRIPTEAEVREFAAAPAKTRRNDLIDKLLKDERFADRWTLFYADMLRLRSNAVGGSALMAYVHNALKNGMPYDEMCRKLISSNGKAGRIPEAGFVLADDADPLAMASITSQVFMGVRIGCAQCHDHPFDVWSRRDFYDLAAFYGKTRRFESQLTKVVFATEAEQQTVLWPPEGVGPADERKPIPAKFPFGLESFTSKPEHIKRMEQVRADKLAALKPKEDKGPSVDDLLAESSAKVEKTTSGELSKELALADSKKDIRKIDINKGMYVPSELREDLAKKVTDPRNKRFSQALVNRVWKTLVGRAFVEPVDDFRDDNPAAHPQALEYLAKEFVASDFELRSLVRLIVSSDAYQRSHAPFNMDQPTRSKMEEHLLATPVRRMIAESLYDSIVTAGHLFEPKHSPGMNEKTVYDIVRVAKNAKPVDLTKTEGGLLGKKPGMTAMAGKPMSAAGYELEGAIELDFNALLKDQGDDEEVALDEMKAMSKEEIEAARMMQQKMMRAGSMEYEEKKVARTFDDNPVFNTSLRMQSPAPDGHFLRIFGQPNRTELGDLRDDTASMRQALMMLNGRITHEAARVGDLEPVHALLQGKKQNLDEAVKFAYMEILTRRPNAEELTEGKEIIKASTSPLEGMADLRWVLLNCNEFRFLP
jgi:hypothetical protein